MVNLEEVIEKMTDDNITSDLRYAKALLKSLNTTYKEWLREQRILPAKDELAAAILQANESVKTISHMGSALIRLNDAIAECKDLEIEANMPVALDLHEKLTQLKAAYVQMKAAIVQGQIALEGEEGEEAAMRELQEAVDLSKKLELHRDLPVAVDLLEELMHMNAQHQRMSAALAPR